MSDEIHNSSILEDEYLQTFKTMVEIFFRLGVTSPQLEIVKVDILTMLLSAQQEDKAIEGVFGKDLDGFCEEYIRYTFPFRPINNIFSALMAGSLFLCLVGVLFGVINFFVGETNDLFREAFNGLPLVGILIGTGFMKIYQDKIGIENQKKNLSSWYKNYFIASLIIAIPIFLCAFLISEWNFGMYIYLGDLIALSLGVATMAMIGELLYRMIRSSMWKNEKNIVKNMQEHYNKINMKHTMTQDKFVRYTNKKYGFLYGVLTPITIGMGILLSSIIIFGDKATGVLGITSLLMVAIGEAFVFAFLVVKGIQYKMILRKLLKKELFLGENINNNKENNSNNYF